MHQDELDNNILKHFVLKNVNIDEDKYLLHDFHPTVIADNTIFMVIQLKSMVSQMVSTNHIIVNTFEINIDDYNFYSRRKKLINYINIAIKNLLSSVIFMIEIYFILI